MTASLYFRLGETSGIETLVDDIMRRHLNNPTIRARVMPFAAEPARMKVATDHLVRFLEAGSGGPERYTGRSMPDAHRGMNISGEEYFAAIEDIMGALQDAGADEQTQKDVLYITYSLKSQIAQL